MLLLVFLGGLLLAINVKPVRGWVGTIYILADGSVYPQDAPLVTSDYTLYRLTDYVVAISGDGIVVERDNIVIDGAGHTIEGVGELNSAGINVSGRVNVKMANLTIKNFDYGIYLNQSNQIDIAGNIIVDNTVGVYIEHSFSVSVVANNISSNLNAVILQYSLYNDVINNYMTHNDISGIQIRHSDLNTLARNNVSDNFHFGLWIWNSSYNTIVENDILGNQDCGIYIDGSNNLIYHNNFINNNQQVDCTTLSNSWDNGYPSGGNYWGDYTATDMKNGANQDQFGPDGICDSAYYITRQNVDNYPLVAPIKIFKVGVWDQEECYVNLITNSTVSGFKINIAEKTLSFNVSGAEGTTGFCRAIIPSFIVQDLWNGNYKVLLNGVEWPFQNWTDYENTYIYIDYTHSEHEVIIVAEYRSFALLALLLITITAITAISKRRY